MYDDDVHAQSMMNMFGNTFYRVARFPTKNITTPIVLVWGGSDSLVDIRVMLKELPGHTIDIGVRLSGPNLATSADFLWPQIPHYEHLDMLWAQDVDRLVFPTILESLETYSYSCEGEDDDSSFVRHRSYVHPRDTKKTNPIPQSMVRRGSTGRSNLGSNTLTESLDLLSYSEGERNTNTERPMDDVDGVSSSTSSVAPPVHNSRLGQESGVLTIE